MIKSLLKGLVTAWFVATAAFFCLRLSPGDPVERILGAQARPEQIELYRTSLGLDLPIMTQYRVFLTNLVQLDWGKSLFKDKTVLELIREAMVPTATLAVIAVSLAFVLASLLGVYAAKNRGNLIDHLLRFLTLSALSFPIFSLAPILIILFAIELGWLPVSELISPLHYILPCLSLIIPLTSVLSRVIRNQYLESTGEPWINVLRAKGLGDGAITFRIYKVCLPTILNVVSMQLSVVLAGAMITETIFDIPGLGKLLLGAIENRDYPLVQGLIIYTSLIYLLLYVITDIVNAKIDPRLESAK
ncbi:MAG: glutathione ABC transporter permease GsiC [Halobacteriovorax sp.]|nr:glutathione ABC transporter permease GsiC [Halobacteriovorax sp.]